MFRKSNARLELVPLPRYASPELVCETLLRILKKVDDDPIQRVTIEAGGPPIRVVRIAPQNETSDGEALVSDVMASVRLNELSEGAPTLETLATCLETLEENGYIPVCWLAGVAIERLREALGRPQKISFSTSHSSYLLGHPYFRVSTFPDETLVLLGRPADEEVDPTESRVGLRVSLEGFEMDPSSALDVKLSPGRPARKSRVDEGRADPRKASRTS